MQKKIFPDSIISIHLELTDKCQASCPMCPRNIFGGPDGPNVYNVEITLEQFKIWFSERFLQQLTDIFVCGNLGDPLMAHDCLEIFRYVKTVNPNCKLHVYTNGSLRNAQWWQEYSKVIGPNDQTIFAIDGFEDTHHLYRKGTNWQKIIDNAQILIDAGGVARADTLVFEHNQHQIEDLTKFLLERGFFRVNARTTDRFYGFDKYPVHNKKGQWEYDLRPANTDHWRDKFTVNFAKLADPIQFQDVLNRVEVSSKCGRGESIYINSQGYIYPCCWVGSAMENNKNLLAKNDVEGVVRARFHGSAQEIVQDIGQIRLSDQDIVDTLNASVWNDRLPKHYTTDIKLMCAKSCGTNFGKIITEP